MSIRESVRLSRNSCHSGNHSGHNLCRTCWVFVFYIFIYNYSIYIYMCVCVRVCVYWYIGRKKGPNSKRTKENGPHYGDQKLGQHCETRNKLLNFLLFFLFLVLATNVQVKKKKASYKNQPTFKTIPVYNPSPKTRDQ